MELSLEFLQNKRVKWAAYGLSGVLGIAILAFGYFFYYPAFQFHVFVTGAVIFSLLLPGILISYDHGKKRKIDNMLPRFLEDVAESQESGLTLLKAFEESSKRNYGPITKELKHLVAQLTWGVEFEVAFNSFAGRIDTELSAKVTVLLLEAMRLGGDLRSTFNSVGSFVREMITLRDERESELKAYMMIIYMSVVVFMIVIMILYNSFFLNLASQQSAAGGFGGLPMSLEKYKAILFDLVIVVAFFGGITAGKLSAGSAVAGIKHAVILLTMITVVFGLFFLDPNPPIISDIVLTPFAGAMGVTCDAKDPFPSSGVNTVTLVWTQDGWNTNQTAEMTINIQEEIYKGQVPSVRPGTVVSFYIEARDNSQNLAVDDNNQLYYSYIAGG